MLLICVLCYIVLFDFGFLVIEGVNNFGFIEFEFCYETQMKFTRDSHWVGWKWNDSLLELVMNSNSVSRLVIDSVCIIYVAYGGTQLLFC